MPFPAGWPPRAATSHRSIRFFVGATATANFVDNAFLFAEGSNLGVATIGLVVNGQVVVHTTVITGAAADAHTIEVVIPAPSTALAATLTGTDILVELATNAAGGPIDASNTATLVAAAINALTGITSFANGSGATSLFKAEVKKNFFGGSGIAMRPMPFITPGDALTPARVGDLQAGGTPMGGGTNDADPESYGAPTASAFASTLYIANDDGTATNTIEYSFDGINVHGEVLGGEAIRLYSVHESGIAVRFTAGTPAFRVIGW